MKDVSTKGRGKHELARRKTLGLLHDELAISRGKMEKAASEQTQTLYLRTSHLNGGQFSSDGEGGGEVRGRLSISRKQGIGINKADGPLTKIFKRPIFHQNGVGMFLEGQKK